jgi:hypothetical protein
VQACQQCNYLRRRADVAAVQGTRTASLGFGYGVIIGMLVRVCVFNDACTTVSMNRKGCIRKRLGDTWHTAQVLGR